MNIVMHHNNCNHTTNTNNISPFTNNAYKSVTNIVNVHIQYVHKFALDFQFHRSLIVGKYAIKLIIHAILYNAINTEIITSLIKTKSNTTQVYLFYRKVLL
jgi:hypothetical protein